jgi:UDP-3-O-[3-hydroxymyristoyl] glucosamine N-acyltransferase
VGKASPPPRTDNAPLAITLSELAARTGATLEGDGATLILRVATLESAGPGTIAFLANPKYRDQLAQTRAAAVILAPNLVGRTDLPRLVSRDPYVTYAKVAAILHPPGAQAPGIHAAAVVSAKARIPASATVGANAVLGDDVVVGERAWIGAGTVLGDAVTIGEDVLLHANVTVYDRCVIGARSIVHSGAVIGADGFGMAEEAGIWLKIPQVGRVVLGTDVEVGANTTIDRGAIDDTVIEDGVKLDNQIQIGHNCRIGAHTAIAGCVGIAGSTRIGRHCKIGGAAMLNGHIDLCDGVVVLAGSGIRDSITTPGIYAGGIPALPHAQWRHLVPNLLRLPALAKRLRALERAVGGPRRDASEPKGEEQ